MRPLSCAAQSPVYGTPTEIAEKVDAPELVLDVLAKLRLREAAAKDASNAREEEESRRKKSSLELGYEREVEKANNRKRNREKQAEERKKLEQQRVEDDKEL